MRSEKSGSSGIWRDGLKNTFKWLAVLLLVSASAGAESYRSVLKDWTRKGRDYTVDNLEMRLSWQATYLSGEFRSVRRERMSRLLEWSEEEAARQRLQDEREAQAYDEFIVGIYAGSNAYPEIGKETGEWRIALAVGEATVRPVLFERVRINEVDQQLYPHLTRWSKAFRIRFPKTIQPGSPFALKMMGIPARSELVWK